MSSSVYNYLDDYGTQQFINVIMQVIEENMLMTFTNRMDLQGDDEHIPTVGTVDQLLSGVESKMGETNELISEVRNAIHQLSNRINLNQIRTEALSDVLTHLGIDFVTGPITQVTAPVSTTIYLQRDDEFDQTWTMNIYDEINHRWKTVGEMKMDLLKYWSKDETEAYAERFYEQTMEPMSEELIRGKTNEMFQFIIDTMDAVTSGMMATYTTTLAVNDNEHIPTMGVIKGQLKGIQSKIDNVSDDISNVNDILEDFSAGLHIDLNNINITSGSMEDIVNPNSQTIYINTQFGIPGMYLYSGEQFIPIGNAKEELNKHWNVEETDELADQFYEHSMHPMTEDEIRAKTEEMFEYIIEIMDSITMSVDSIMTSTMSADDNDHALSNIGLNSVLRGINNKIEDVGHSITALTNTLSGISNALDIDLNTIDIVNGSTDSISNPNDQTLYVIYDGKYYILNLYNGEEFIPVGNPRSELDKCWNIDDTEELIQRFYEHSMVPMDENTIKNKAESIYANTLK